MLRRLQVLTCDERWEAMPGDPGGTTRSCERCRMSVNDVSTLDSGQLEALVEGARQRRTCVRVELVGGRPMLRTGLAAGLLVAALSACATSAHHEAPHEFTVHPGEPGEGGLIAGTISNRDGNPLTNAIVVLQGDFGIYERQTGHHGGYAFSDLPPGHYTVQVLAGKANHSRIVELPADGQVRVNFRLDPAEDQIMGMLLEPSPLDVSSPASSVRTR